MYLIVMRNCCGTFFRHVFIPSIICLYFASNLSNHLQRAKTIHNSIYSSLVFCLFVSYFFLTTALHFYQKLMGPVSTKDSYLYIMANDEAPTKRPKTSSRCDIVECHMLGQFSHLFACYWELLRKVLILSNVCANNSQHFFCV